MKPLALVLLLLTLAPPVSAEDGDNAVLDGEAFNVIAFDGPLTYTWHVGDPFTRTRYATYQSGLHYVEWSTGAVPLQGLSALALVLVNDALRSYPEPTVSVQPFAMGGIDYAQFDPSGGVAPDVVADLQPGSYVGVRRVTFRLIGNYQPPVSMSYRHNGLTYEVTGARVTVTLGVGVNIFKVKGFFGEDSVTRELTYTITERPGGPNDSDQDGIPDAVEAAARLDALTPDVTYDGDGDGWSNIDEWLRGCPGEDGITTGATADCVCVVVEDRDLCEPLDSDEDGFSDWDERWRDTDPNHDASYPAARGLYEPEAKLEAYASEDAAGVVPYTGAATFGVVDARGRPLESRRHTGGPQLGPVNRLPTEPGDLFPLIEPPSIRTSASLPFVVRAHIYNAMTGQPTPSAVKTLVPAIAAFGPADLAEAMLGTWSDADQFRTNAAAVLASRLVQLVEARASQPSTVVVVLLESLVAWHAGLDLEQWVVYADGSSFPAEAAAALGDHAALFTGLGAFVEHQAFDALRAEAEALYDSVGTWSAENADTVDAELAYWLQQGKVPGAPQAERPRIAARAYAFLGDRLTGEALVTSVTTPSADFDGDGLTHRVELAGPAARATDPLLANSDGDADNDATDPCPLDATDACWPGLPGLADGDGDTVLNGYDNCPNIANATQLDGDGDGIGDACESLYGVIDTPRSDMNVFIGETIAFRAVATGLVPTSEITYTWTFDGAAAPASGKDPIVTFDTPRATPYLVTLTTTRTGGTSTTDTRKIGVRGVVAVPPSLVVTVASIGTEGTPHAYAATVGAGVTVAWDFGDSTAAAGPSGTHVYAQQGLYTLRATATDATTGLSTVVERELAIDDTEPTPSFTWSAGDFDLEVDLSDTSTAYDLIDAATWVVLGTSLAAQGPAVTLELPGPGTWTVRLTVTDDDGSDATIDQVVTVTGSGMQLVRAEVSGAAWQTIVFPRAMVDPVVLVGIPTTRGNNRGYIGVRNVTTTGFQARYLEWDYHNGPHTAEAVAFLAIEAGRHERSDGSEWVAGRFTQDTDAWQDVEIPQRVHGRPTLLAGLMTSGSVMPTHARFSELTRKSFRARLFHEAAQASSPFAVETLGFLMIAGDAGTVPVNRLPVAFSASGARLRHDWRQRDGFTLRLEEEKSLDPDVTHVFEDGRFLVIDGAIFGTINSLEEAEPFVIRQRE